MFDNYDKNLTIHVGMISPISLCAQLGEIRY